MARASLARFPRAPVLVLRGLSALALAAATASPEMARAADDDAAAASDPSLEARQQYEVGMQAYQAKRFVEAALHFEAAAAQKPHAVTLYTAALAWEQANRPDRAADDFQRALAVAGPGLSAAQTQNAHDRLATLEKTMGTLVVVARDGWRAQIDANTEVSTPAHLHALPGVHVLVGHGPAGTVERRDVMLEIAKTAHVEISPVPPAPSPEAAAPPHGVLPELGVRAHAARGLEVRRLVGVGVAGIGLGALAAGAVLGFSALGARDAYNASPSRTAYDHANALATWTDVAFIAGGVLVAGGAALVLWPSREGPSRERDGACREPAVALVPAPGGAALWGVF